MQQEMPVAPAPDSSIPSQPPAPSLYGSSPVRSHGTVVAIGIAIVVVAIGSWFLFSSPRAEGKKLTTYFSYSADDLTVLKGLKSDQVISSDDVYRWDQNMFDTVAREQVLDVGGTASKLYAYEAVAERDFAYLSYNATGRFEGNFDQLSKDIACSFFAQQCPNIEVRGTEDPLSAALHKVILAKVSARIAQDTVGLKVYSRMEGDAYWNGPEPRAGADAGSSLGWFITTGDQFRAPPPPEYGSEEFKKQVEMTKTALTNATPEQKRATVFWAGVPGTKTPPGQILQLGDNYMQEKTVPLAKVLLVRSVLAMSIADAVTAVFDSKYTYQVKRPFMMDSSIKTIMPTPNHPSYPAGHSTLSTAGSTVLAHYFPADTAMWNAKAYEAGMSRIWGGIHYLMDHEAGVNIGKSVGNAAINATSSQVP